MMTVTCATCQFWGTARERELQNRLRSCAAPAMHYGYHMAWDDIRDAAVLIEDDEGWGMLTGPAFGCVHWQADGRGSPAAGESGTAPRP